MADLAAWIGRGLATPHEFACLALGVEPTAPNGRRPSIPDGYEVDVEDWDNDYRRIHSVLTAAIDDGLLEVHGSHRRVGLLDALDALQRAADQGGWPDWLGEFDLVKELRRGRSSAPDAAALRIAELEERVRTLEAGNARFSARYRYSTPLLEAVWKVVDHFYAAKSLRN